MYSYTNSIKDEELFVGGEVISARTLSSWSGNRNLNEAPFI